MYSFVRSVTPLIRSSVLRAAVSNNCNAFNHTSSRIASANMPSIKFCTIPASFADKTVSFKCYAEATRPCNKSGDTVIPEFTIAKFECNEGYTNGLGNKFRSVCSESEWVPPIYKCNSRIISGGAGEPPTNSGAGLVFRDGSAYYVRGILSQFPLHGDLSLFIDLGTHIDWILSVRNEVEENVIDKQISIRLRNKSR
ncbi:hypothetical protein U1Q18_049094 [Sarracenia purpurea var. burkii]